jgi:glycosyltransferase involved in cell wall biosynthesis
MGYVVPINCPKPSVVTFHDITPLTHPHLCRKATVAHFEHTLPRSARLARRIAVPTRAVAETVCEKLGVKEDRLDVIPWGVDESFRPINDEALLREARAAWRLPEKYVLFVGNQEPKKNLTSLIQAFFAARAHKNLPHKLLLVGQYGWKCGDMFRLIRTLDAAGYVFFTGYVPREALPFLYNMADLFVFPSIVEGFGMPVLEAMACGCPVIISEDRALREVAGGAAREVPHDRLPALREAIESLLEDEAERKKLRTRGIERARAFSWRRTAELTLECYTRAMQ